MAHTEFPSFHGGSLREDLQVDCYKQNYKIVLIVLGCVVGPFSVAFEHESGGKHHFSDSVARVLSVNLSAF